MKKQLLSSLAVLSFLIAPVALAHESGEAHEEPTSTQRQGGVNPVAAAGFGIVLVGLGGFFAYNKFRKKGSSSQTQPPPK